MRLGSLRVDDARVCFLYFGDGRRRRRWRRAHERDVSGSEGVMGVMDLMGLSIGDCMPLARFRLRLPRTFIRHANGSSKRARSRSSQRFSYASCANCVLMLVMAYTARNATAIW